MQQVYIEIDYINEHFNTEIEYINQYINTKIEYINDFCEWYISQWY